MAMSPAERAFLDAFECTAATETLAPIREEVPEVPGAFLIRNAFSQAETDALTRVVRLAHSESILPRRDSGTTTTRRFSQHHKPVRVSVTAIAPLAERMRGFLPKTAGPNCSATIAEPGHEISGFLRCYHYLPGDTSMPHFDRSFSQHSAGVQTAFSAYSMLLYLSDSGELAGGHTTFFTCDENAQFSAQGLTPLCDRCDLSVAAHVVPCCGDVLVFPHGNHPGCHPNPLHEGSTVLNGEKLLIRTDVVYNSEPFRSKSRGAAAVAAANRRERLA